MGRMILGIDPGETVGLATMSSDGQLKTADELSADKTIDYFALFAVADLSDQPYFDIDAIVIEDFRLFQGKQMAQTGSRFEAVQIIGAARLYARILNVPIITQSPQILRLTEMHMHWPRHAENSHIPDHLSAQLHLLHYAETQGIPTTRLRELNPDILHP